MTSARRECMGPSALPPDAVPGILGDIVERTFTDGDGGGACAPSARSASRPLRPVAAVAGVPFPSVDPRRGYGLTSAPHRADDGRRAQPTTVSAHVQPEDAETAASRESAPFARQPLLAPSLPPADGEQAGAFLGAMLPVGGSAASRCALARQWTVADFTALYEGYYTVPLPAAAVTAAVGPLTSALPSIGAEAATRTAPTGEDFFNALFACLRSTVRRHQSIVLDALLQHLRQEGASKASTADGSHSNALRERCVRGPDCAPFIFLILEVLRTAGHPSHRALAAACLVALLQQPSTEGGDDVVGLVGEVGSPRADAAAVYDADGEEEGEEGDEGAGDAAGEQHPVAKPTTVDRLDLPFGELSETLRTDGELRAGLEKMGFTNAVMGALNAFLLSPQSEAAPAHAAAPGLLLWLRLLACGAVGESAAVSRRVAGDPDFLSCVVEPLLSEAVLTGGLHPSGAAAAQAPTRLELLRVLHRLAHIPSACRCLLYGSSSRSGRSGSCSDHGDSACTASNPVPVDSSARSGRTTGRSSLYETWLLYFITVLTIAPAEVNSLHDVAAVLCSLLILREFVQQGHVGVAYDLSSTLLADGMRVGAGIVLEMLTIHLSRTTDSQKGAQQIHWGQRQHARAGAHLPGQESEPNTRSAEPSSAAQLLRDAAVLALASLSSDCRAPAPLAESALPTGHDEAAALQHERDGASTARSALAHLTATSNRHFLATYMRHHRVDCLTVLGDATSTQTAMQRILSDEVLRPELLRLAFPRVRRHAAGREEDAWQWLLALRAALVHANCRLGFAIAQCYPAVERDGVLTYAVALATDFLNACLERPTSLPQQLHTDELCTLVEVLGVLRELPQHPPHSSRSCSSAPPPPLPSAATAEGPGIPPERRDGGGQYYAHIAQTLAVFLGHGIALTKQCLDAAPMVVASMLDVDVRLLTEEISAEERKIGHAATDSSDRTALARSLLEGIQQTPVPPPPLSPSVGTSASALGGSVAGAPRSWVLHPLYDGAVLDKTAWARWLRQLLGLHRRMKTVLGWDAVLSHTLLWELAHRGELFSPPAAGTERSRTDADEFSFEEADDGRRAHTSRALCDLTSGLAELLLLQLPPPSSTGLTANVDGSSQPGEAAQERLFSAPASRVLEVALTDYADPQTEDGLPRPLFLVLLLLAAYGEPTVALAILQVLLLTPIVDSAESLDDARATNSPTVSSLSPSLVRIAEWALSWTDVAPPSTGAAGFALRASADGCAPSWSLEQTVRLLQLSGPFLACAEATLDEPEGGRAGMATVEDLLITSTAEEFHSWCVHALTHGLLRRFIAQQQQQQQARRRAERQATGAPPDTPAPLLTRMQRAVLRGTLEELAWEPQPLWQLVQEEDELLL